MNKILWFFLLMVLVSWTAVPVIRTPEIGAHDVHGYDTWKVRVDPFYDAQWNTKYYIQGNRVYRVELEG
jgi:hypothetical protein